MVNTQYTHIYHDISREKTERCHGLFLGEIPESDTPSMDIENVDKANVYECSQRVIYNVHNFWFCSVLCARNAGSTRV